MILISVLIPAHNAQDYIAECLDSIFHQELYSSETWKLENIEVLVANDGSTDQTPLILDKYANKYSNLHI